MNLPIILFVFISIFFCIYDESCGTSDDDVTLSPESEQELQENAGNPDALKQFFLRRKRKHNQEINNVNEKLLSTQFICGIITAKAEINLLMDSTQIFHEVPIKDDDKTLWKSIHMPLSISNIMLKWDDVDKNAMQNHQRYFRNFYFRLKDTESDKINDDIGFMKKLRELINQEYDGKDIDETYKRFSATIVRDYNFFCDYYHDKLLNILNRLGHSTNDDILYHLFEINENWFMSGEHITNINILRKAFYGSEITEIKGFVCRNKNNVDIQLPLFDKCGRITPTIPPSPTTASKSP